MAYSRREFLGCGGASALTAGGLVATAALPALADDAVGSSSRPCQGEAAMPLSRESIVLRHIHIGLPKAFSVMHISDTHLCEAYPDEGDELVAWAKKRNEVFGRRQKESLAAMIDWGRKNDDYLLHTGDLIDFQSRANFDSVKKFFGTAANILGATGNHEYQRLPGAKGIRNTAEYNLESKAALDAACGFDTTFRAAVVEGVNFVTIDQTYGTVTAEQATKFEAEAKKGLPTVLCQHAPFETPETWLLEMKYWRFRDRKFELAKMLPPYGDYRRQNESAVTQDFIKYLKSLPNLRAILAGHLHVTLEDRFSPTATQYLIGGNYAKLGAEIIFT